MSLSIIISSFIRLYVKGNVTDTDLFRTLNNNKMSLICIYTNRKISADY